jgi:hypothetical protein
MGLHHAVEVSPPEKDSKTASLTSARPARYAWVNLPDYAPCMCRITVQSVFTSLLSWCEIATCRGIRSWPSLAGSIVATLMAILLHSEIIVNLVKLQINATHKGAPSL